MDKDRNFTRNIDIGRVDFQGQNYMGIRKRGRNI